MDIQISIPGSTATIKVAMEGDKVLLEPVNFDRNDPNQIAALATAIGMVKNSSIDLPGDDSIHEKVAVVAIPAGNEQAQLPTQPPPADPAAQAAGDANQAATMMPEIMGRLDAIEQQLGIAAQGGQAPPAPGAPAPQQAAPAPEAPPAEGGGLAG